MVANNKHGIVISTIAYKIIAKKKCYMPPRTSPGKGDDLKFQRFCKVGLQTKYKSLFVIFAPKF